MAELRPLDAVWQALPAAAGDRCFVVLVGIGEPAVASRALRGSVRDMLCAEERARLDAFTGAEAAWEYAASHGALRLLLGRCLGVPAASVTFSNPGTPFVAPDPVDAGPHRWRASLSHSAPFAAIGLAEGGAVGVDVEPLRRETTAREAAGQFLCAEEAARLAELPARDQGAAALRAWCLKEAALKALGVGFGTDPKSIRLHIDPPAACKQAVVPAGGGAPLYLWALRYPSSSSSAAAWVALALENESASVVLTDTALDALLRIGDAR